MRRVFQLSLRTPFEKGNAQTESILTMHGSCGTLARGFSGFNPFDERSDQDPGPTLPVRPSAAEWKEKSRNILSVSAQHFVYGESFGISSAVPLPPSAEKEMDEPRRIESGSDAGTTESSKPSIPNLVVGRVRRGWTPASVSESRSTPGAMPV